MFVVITIYVPVGFLTEVFSQNILQDCVQLLQPRDALLSKTAWHQCTPCLSIIQLYTANWYQFVLLDEQELTSASSLSRAISSQKVDSFRTST